MKKFLEHRFALGLSLSAILIASLFVPGFLGKMLVIGFVWALQYLLERTNKDLDFGWDSFISFGPKEDNCLEPDVKRNIWFSFVKLFSVLLFIAYGIHYSSIQSVNMLTIIIVVIIPIVWFLINYGNHLSPYIYRNIRRWVVMCFVACSLVMVFLNFGTWYVWLSPALILIMFLNGMLVKMMKELYKQTSKSNLLFSALLMFSSFLVCIVSLIFQSWSGICNIFINVVNIFCKYFYISTTFEITPGITTGKIIVVLLAFLFVVRFIFGRIKRSRYEKESAIEAEKLEKEKREAQLKKELANKEAEEKRKADEEKKQARFYKIFVSLANDVPISEDDLIYLSKNISFPNEFPISKLVNFDFTKLFFVSKLKKKITWHNNLESVLKMYNSFFKSNYADTDLTLIMGAVNFIYGRVDKFSDYESFNTFKKMVKDSTPNLVSFWTEKEKEL